MVQDYVSTFFKKPLNLLFLLILTIGILLRIKFTFVNSLWPDEVAYIFYGPRILEYPQILFSTGPYTFWPYGNFTQMPGILIAFFSIFTSDFIAGRLMALTYAIAGLIFIYILGKEIGNKYVGLAALLLMTFNPQTWFHSTRTLVDAPLTTMYVITIYLLIRYEKKRENKCFYLLITSIIATILTKLPGFIILGVILVYYFLKLCLIKKNKIKRIDLIQDKRLIIGGGLFFLIIFLFRNILLRHIKAISFDPFYFMSLPLFFGWSIIIFLIAGIILILFYKKIELLAILSWLVVFDLAFVLRPALNDPRYLLPIFPAIFLISSWAMLEIIKYIKLFTKIRIPKFAILIVIVIICFPFYKQADALLVSKSYSYTGYDESGRWFDENIDFEKDIVVVGGTVWMQVYSKYRDFNHGGKGMASFQFETIDDFKQLISNNTDKNIYLQLSIWEYGNPGWVFPVTQQVIDNLMANGFQIVKVVERPIMTQQGMQNAPVLIILKHAAVKETKINNNNVTQDDS